MDTNKPTRQEQALADLGLTTPTRDNTALPDLTDADAEAYFGVEPGYTLPPRTGSAFDEQVLDELVAALPAMVEQESGGQVQPSSTVTTDEVKAALREELAALGPRRLTEISVSDAVAYRVKQLSGSAVAVWSGIEARHDTWVRTVKPAPTASCPVVLTDSPPAPRAVLVAVLTGFSLLLFFVVLGHWRGGFVLGVSTAAAMVTRAAWVPRVRPLALALHARAEAFMQKPQ